MKWEKGVYFFITFLPFIFFLDWTQDIPWFKLGDGQVGAFVTIRVWSGIGGRYG